MASQITSLAIVFSSVYSGADKKKPSKLRVTGLCVGNSRWPVNFPHKWPVTRKMVLLMTSSCENQCMSISSSSSVAISSFCFLNYWSLYFHQTKSDLKWLSSILVSHSIDVIKLRIYSWWTHCIKYMFWNANFDKQSFQISIRKDYNIFMSVLYLCASLFSANVSWAFVTGNRCISIGPGVFVAISATSNISGPFY